MPDIFQFVDLSIGTVETLGIFYFLNIVALYGVLGSTVQLDADSRQGQEETFHNGHSHLVEASAGVTRGEFLVLVIIALGDIDLTNAFRGRNSKNLCQNSDLDTPVGG